MSTSLKIDCFSLIWNYFSPPPQFLNLQGIRNVPNKVRIIIQRRRNEDDEDSEEMYSLVTLAEDQNTKGKGVVVLEA